MNLYLIKQGVNNDYDTYSEAVVAAEDESIAQRIHPAGDLVFNPGTGSWERPDQEGDGYIYGIYGDSSWTSPENVIVELIGTAIPDTKQGVICASFHAG